MTTKMTRISQFLYLMNNLPCFLSHSLCKNSLLSSHIVYAKADSMPSSRCQTVLYHFIDEYPIFYTITWVFNYFVRSTSMQEQNYDNIALVNENCRKEKKQHFALLIIDGHTIYGPLIDIAALLKRSIENYYEILCCFGRQNLYYSSNQAMAAASFF